MSKEKGIYLVARYFMKPRDRVNTSVKGWMDNPENIRYDESMAITRGLKTKDSTGAQVILDLSKKAVVKNSFRSEKEFDEIFLYFFQNYSNYLIPVMGQLDPAYLDKIASDLKAQFEAMGIPVEMTNEEMQAAQQADIIDVKHEEVQAQ